jgi:hypothetical protein
MLNVNTSGGTEKVKLRSKRWCMAWVAYSGPHRRHRTPPAAVTGPPIIQLAQALSQASLPQNPHCRSSHGRRTEHDSNTSQQQDNVDNVDDMSHPHRGSPPTCARLRDAKTTQRSRSAPMDVSRHSRGSNVVGWSCGVCMSH